MQNVYVMYIEISYKFHRISDTQSRVLTKVYDFLGQPSYIEKHAICHKDYRLQSCLRIQYVHGDICKHLGIDSSTDRMIGNQPVLEYGFFHLFIPRPTRFGDIAISLASVHP